MSDLLIVLNPRKIAECVRAIQELPIDKVWVRNYRLPEVEDLWPELLASFTKYERWLIISDDSIPRPHALGEVQKALDDHPVVTGYCNLSREDMRVNLTRSPLIGDTPTEQAYDLYDFDEIQSWPDALVPTWLAGFSLTGMSYELWQRYPLRCFTNQERKYGWAADFNLCKRLERDDIPIVGCRDAFVYHVKDVWNQMDLHPRKQLYCEIEPSEVVFEACG